MISATISGVSVSVGNASFTIEDPLEARAILTFTVLDSSGTASYQRGQPVTFSDPGIISYTGYVQSDTPMKEGIILPYVEHVIVCMDGEYNLDKRSNSTNYLNWVAGNIAVDFVRRDLAAEGITIAAAMHRDTTVADFNAGTLSGVVGAINGIDDGDLELPLAGSVVAISEVSQTDFSTGTLTNVTAPAGGGLTPTLTPTLQLVGTGSGTVYVAIWSGSQVIGTSDTLVYSTYNDAVASAGSINFTCSDGSNYQQNIGTDTTTNPGTGWWARTITLPSFWNGKTITQVQAVMTNATGTAPNAYFQNVHLGSASGSPFFSTTLNLTPFAVVLSGYTNVTTQVFSSSLLNVTTQRQSTAYSIAAAGILKSAYLSYIATTPAGTGFTINISSDGGATWYACTNNVLLPVGCLTPGMNLSGISLLIQEVFTNTATAPTSFYASLTSLTLTIEPAATATKTDVSYIVDTQAGWQAGTLTNVIAQSNNTLTMPSTSSFGTYTTHDSGGIFFEGADANLDGFQVELNSASVQNAHIQLTGPGTYTAMTLYVNVSVTWTGTTVSTSAGGPTYLSPQWNGTAGTFGYCVLVTAPTVGGFDVVQVSLLRGSAGGSTTTLAGPITVPISFSFTQPGFIQCIGTMLKVVYVAGNHKVYANNILIINVNDSTFTSAADLGFYASSAGNVPSDNVWANFKNFVVTSNPTSSGTFVSPATSLTPVGTYGTSLVDWSVLTPSVLQNLTVEASIDGGSTYTACTSGQPIPGITAGTSMSGKSLVMRVTLLSQVISNISTISGLRALVIGQYSSTGTRSTAPMGNDMQITRTVGSGWGNAFDGQPWSQNGTGTTAVGTGEATITNTTGTVYMRLGTLTGTNIQGTHRFSLSSSSETAGIFLRYVDANNYYALAATTSTVSLLKRLAGVTTTLASMSMALSVNTPYRMHFLTANASPVSLFGNVWPDGSLEPTVNSLGQWNDSLWAITASD